MIVFDNFTFDKLENLKSLLSENKIKFFNISNITDEIKENRAICLFSVTEDSFFDEDTVKFLREQNNFEELNIITIFRENKIFDDLIFEKWIKILTKTRNKIYKVIKKLDNLKEVDIFEFIKTTINNLNNNQKNKVIIYTDGSCSCNPGPGGWGAILMTGDKIKEISGGEEYTTNNRMEIMAVIKALEMLKKPCQVELYSDSAYVVNAFEQKWIESWKANNWKNSSKKEPVKNIDLWKILDNLTQVHDVNFIKVKGHADNEYNNRCDELAVLETNKFIYKLEQKKDEINN